VAQEVSDDKPISSMGGWEKERLRMNLNKTGSTEAGFGSRDNRPRHREVMGTIDKKNYSSNFSVRNSIYGNKTRHI
jgi:hypothetical protein